jgi:hypothetical protein
MKLKSNKDHYQGQNEAWKSAIHILWGLLLNCHINFKKDWKNLRFLPQVHILTFASTLKISAQNFEFWPLFKGVKDCWMAYLYFKKFHVYAGLGSLWLGTWWVRGELRLTLAKEEVLDSIPVGGDWYHDVEAMRWWIKEGR